MTMVIAMLIVLLAVVISNVGARFIPGIASTYISIGLGILIGIWPLTNRFIPVFNDEMFMLLFLAPLLYFEGQRTPIFFVRKRLGSIMGTAIWLAIATAVIGAALLHWVFGEQLALALVIVAIAVPTDATAFDAVVEGRKISKPVRKTLVFEAMFNDATGLVLLQAGLLWLRTGHLTFWQNTWELVFTSVGGILVGAVIAIIIMLLRQLLLRSNGNVISAQNLIYLITPFIIYLVAEELGVSGIIAVVVAGLVNNSEVARSRFSSPKQTHFGVEMVRFTTEVLNSYIFVVLGVNLVRIVAGRPYHHVLYDSWHWLAVGLLVYLVLIVSRYLYGRFFVADRSPKSALIFALGGVHGTVTLAMTFSISSYLSQTTYALAVVIETVVIVLSMLVPLIVFKLMLPVDVDEENRDRIMGQMREAMVNAALEETEKMNLCQEVAANVTYDLRDQIQANTLHTFFHEWHQTNLEHITLTPTQAAEQSRALMRAFDAERRYLYDLNKQHMVDNSYIHELYSEILVAESLVLDPASQVV